jgi:Cu/Ag efflux pump CusA
MDSISSRKQDFLHTGFQLKFIPENEFPMEMVEFNLSQTLNTSNLKSLNFLTIEVIYTTLELLVKKHFKLQIENDLIECCLKVVELGNSNDSIEIVNFRYIVIGKNLKKSYIKSKEGIREIMGFITDITGGNLNTNFQEIFNKTDLFIQVLPINFPVNMISKRSKLNEDELDFFSDELVDYLLLCPIVYCPKEELQYTNP